jgi:hypothetical protein
MPNHAAGPCPRNYDWDFWHTTLGYIEEFDPSTEEFKKRFNNFCNQSLKGKLFGNWNDERLPHNRHMVL